MEKRTILTSTTTYFLHKSLKHYIIVILHDLNKFKTFVSAELLPLLYLIKRFLDSLSLSLYRHTHTQWLTSLSSKDLYRMWHRTLTYTGVGQDADCICHIWCKASEGGHSVVILDLLLFPEEDWVFRLHCIENLVALDKHSDRIKCLTIATAWLFLQRHGRRTVT